MSQQMLKSSGGVGAATLTSRVLGLAREQVYAAFMGAGGVADAFIYAFMAPNLFRRLLGEGALTAAFIPIFKAREQEGEAAMWRAANAVISALVTLSGLVTVVAMLVITLALTSHRWQPNTRLMLELMRMMFPYMMLACLAAVLIGMCNARGHFFIPALGAAILNVVMIASVLILAPRMGKTLREQIFALAIGVIVAGIAQALFQMPTLRREGFRFEWITPWKEPTVRDVALKMVPSSIGVAAFQINVLCTQSMAFGAHAGIVAVFGYAVRLMELPQGVVGLSLATFLLPTLAGMAVAKEFGQFRSTLRQAVGYLVFVNLLASVLLLTLAEPIIRLLFERGKFHAESTAQVSGALVCLTPGLISFSLVNIFARAMYALEDVKTPAKISIFCLALNLILTGALLFGLNLGAQAMGLANSFTSLCNLCLLLYALRKKLRRLDMQETTAHFPAVGAAAAAAGLLAWNLRLIWETHLGHATLPLKFGQVFGPMIAACLLYFGMTLWLKVPSAQETLTAFLGRLKRAPGVTSNAGG